MSAGAVLVTGGLGYIGSHVVAALIQSGRQPVVVDNLSNADLPVLDALERLCRCPVLFQEGDIRDSGFLRSVLQRHKVSDVLHFAGLKSVADSVRVPLDYYATNVAGTLCLLAALQEAGVRRLVFSSSATVYGEPTTMPIVESQQAAPLHAYGRSKWMVEQMLADLCSSDPQWSAVSLRYFNPAGAHPSGLIGERPSGTPNNLMPYIAQVACGERERLDVFGNDYATRDGTGERDYVHVMDVADAHVSALALAGAGHGHEVINLGTGRASSVLEVIRSFELASGVRIPHRLAPRRDGDIATCYADPTRARERLGWRAHRDLASMCRDANRFATSQVGSAPRDAGRAAVIPGVASDARVAVEAGSG